jgi:hypothetical protein
MALNDTVDFMPVLASWGRLLAGWLTVKLSTLAMPIAIRPIWRFTPAVL